MIELEVSPGAQADAAAEEQLVDGHLTVPGGLEWDETPVERHTIANLRYAGGKEHDVRYVSEVHLDAALAREAEVGRLYDSLVNRSNRERDASYKREAALREELERAKSRYDREVLGLNNEGDPIGGDPAGGYRNDLARVNAAFDELAACVGFSSARLDQTGDSPIDCANQLQQRLTVSEQRAEMLEREFKKLRDVAYGCYQIASSYSGCIDGVEEHGGDDHDDPSCAIFHRLYYAMFDADAALKPAAECEHSFHYFGDYPRRRCNNCNALEVVAEGEGS